MKKLIIILFVCLAILSGCGISHTEEATEPAGQLQMGNPWRSYDTLSDAEKACSLTFPIPGEIAGSYAAETYRVMNNSLLEVRYRCEDTEITVRMQAGDNEDISGIYENFTAVESTNCNGASVTRKESEDYLVYLVHKNGYSFSVCISGTVPESVCNEILSHIC